MRTRWLRSRWTVVALVPAFFLTGFALVAALAGGSEDAQPRAAAEQPGESGELATVVGSSTSGDASIAPPSSTATSRSGGATTATTATTAPPTTTGGGGGGGGGRVPPAPPAGEISIDYGQWEGMFEVSNTELVPDFALSTVVGELRYLGGVDCQVGLVLVKSWYFNGQGQRVGTGLWESTFATGDGGEVTGREPLPFEAYGTVSEFAESAALRFTAVECL